MRCGLLAILAVLMSPTAASGYSFGEWASDQGYAPGDAMPDSVNASHASPAITDVHGIDEFDWTMTPTTGLSLYGNQISSIESDESRSAT